MKFYTPCTFRILLRCESNNGLNLNKLIVLQIRFTILWVIVIFPITTTLVVSGYRPSSPFMSFYPPLRHDEGFLHKNRTRDACRFDKSSDLACNRRYPSNVSQLFWCRCPINSTWSCSLNIIWENTDGSTRLFVAKISVPLSLTQFST